MKIQVVNPWVADEALIAYEREFLPGDVDIVGLKEGVRGSRSNVDRNLPALFDAIVDAEKEGYDAVVVASFRDAGVEVARELVSIPVLGPVNVGLHVSQIIGHRTLLLLTEYARSIFFTRENIRIYGLEHGVVPRGTPRSVPEVFQAYRDYKTTGKISPFIDEIIGICVESIKKEDIDVIVLGCGGLMWMKELIERELAKRGHSITVIDPLLLAIEAAKVLVTLKLSHSKTGYPSPPNACELKQ